MYHAKRMFFDIALEDGVEIISILGNHDVAFRNTNEVHSMEFIEFAYPNVKLIYDTDIIDFDGCKVGLVSWINKENYKERLSFIQNASCEYMLGHFEINGFEMTKGHVCEGGLTQELFARYSEVWSGHFHIKSKNGNIRYLGNPFQTNRGDINNDRGFHVFDTSTRDLKFIKNKYDIYVSYMFDNTMDIINFDYEEYRDKIVIIYVSSLIDCNQKLLNLFVEKMGTYAYSVQVDELVGVKLKENTDVADIDIKTHSEIIKEYVELTVEDVSKHTTINEILIDLYKDAQQNNQTV